MLLIFNFEANIQKHIMIVYERLFRMTSIVKSKLKMVIRFKKL